MTLEALIDFFHGLSPQSVARFPEFYSADAYFKDPFNEVRGVAAIQHIFTHMFDQVGEPRFVVSEKVVDDSGAMLIWTFSFRAARRGGGERRSSAAFPTSGSTPPARSATTAITGMRPRSFT